LMRNLASTSRGGYTRLGLNIVPVKTTPTPSTQLPYRACAPHQAYIGRRERCNNHKLHTTREREMGRKGSRASGGHMPLTHYERTKKFAHPSSTTTSTTQQEDHYGTLSQRLAGHTQYQIGTCALTTQSLFVRRMSDTDPPPLQKKQMDSTDGTNATMVVALCSPSGYIYDPAAIIEYLCQQTQNIRNNTIREQQIADRRIITTQLRQESFQKKRQMDSFQNAQQVIKKKQLVHSVSAKATNATATAAAADDLHRVSYWLSSAQPTIPTMDSGCVDNDIASNNNKNMNPHVNIIGMTLALIQDGHARTGSNSTTTATNSTTPLLLPTTTASSSSSSTKDLLHHQNHNIIQRPLSPMTQQPFQRCDSIDCPSTMLCGIGQVSIEWCIGTRLYHVQAVPSTIPAAVGPKHPQGLYIHGP
jgi:hypothetical protein